MAERFTPQEISQFNASRAKTKRKADAEVGRRKNELKGGQAKKLSAEEISKKTHEMGRSGLYKDVPRENLPARAIERTKSNYRAEIEKITPKNVLHEQALEENKTRDEAAVTVLHDQE